MRTILVVSIRLTASRHAALERLVGTEGRPELVDPGTAAASLRRADVAGAEPVRPPSAAVDVLGVVDRLREAAA